MVCLSKENTAQQVYVCSYAFKPSDLGVFHWTDDVLCILDLYYFGLQKFFFELLNCGFIRE